MKIPLILNQKKVVVDAEPSETLLTILRREQLFSVKCGCQKGICGNCMVLLDGKTAASCIVPVGMVRDAQVVTLEFFQTYPEYNDIMTGFAQAGMHLCGYCNAGRILTAYEVINSCYRPDIKELYRAIDGLAPCCTDRDTFANGILYAIAAKHKREGKRAYVKK